MASIRIYEMCLPVLQDEKLCDEDKTDKLEEMLSGEPSNLKGKALEDAVLGVLWQWRSATGKTSKPPPIRAINITRPRSPAPWLQRSVTPASGTSSPRPAPPFHPPGFGPAAGRSVSAATPSPRASPRLPVATPTIPHSPQLSSYQFSGPVTATDYYNDLDSNAVDLLVNDDGSPVSYGDAASSNPVAMTPYDMLRSIIQDPQRTDDELEHVLEAVGYDFGQAIPALMMTQDTGSQPQSLPGPQPRTYTIGKRMSPASRPVTPAGPQKPVAVCRYWLANGSCARADCRYAHETQKHVCKFWLQGNCFAGDSCAFSHDPVTLMQQMNLNDVVGTPPTQQMTGMELADLDSFPALQPTTSNPYEEDGAGDLDLLETIMQQQTSSSLPSSFIHVNQSASRPGSGHQPNVQDDEAFPTLGSSAMKPNKRHHGKRGGHNGHNGGTSLQAANSLADIVRLSPSPSNSKDAMRRGLQNNRSFTYTGNSSSTSTIPAPKSIPWLETGPGANAAYLRARNEAIKHGTVRNKFLQSASQAYNRNDMRAARQLSLRGQHEDALMREKHREAAQVLFNSRNSHQNGSNDEIYLDLHGLHPDEAVIFLEEAIDEQRQRNKTFLYAIYGTGHHSKNGKNKLGKAVKEFLADGGYSLREFSAPGDKNQRGGILGIDVTSGTKKKVLKDGSNEREDLPKDGKVVVAKRDPRDEW